MNLGLRRSQNNGEESKQFQRCGKLYEAGWGDGGAGGCLQNSSWCQKNPAHLTIFLCSMGILLIINLRSQVAPAPKRKREDEDYDNNWISLPAQIWNHCDCPDHWCTRDILSCPTDFRCVLLGVWHDKMGLWWMRSANILARWVVAKCGDPCV